MCYLLTILLLEQQLQKEKNIFSTVLGASRGYGDWWGQITILMDAPGCW